MGGTQPCITKIQLAPFPGGPRRTAKHFPPQWYFISFRITFLITGATTLCTFCVNTASRGVLKGLNSHTFLKASIGKSNLDAVSKGKPRCWRQDFCRNKHTQTHQLCVPQPSPNSRDKDPIPQPLQLPIFPLKGFSCFFFLPGSSTIFSCSTWGTTNIIQYLS